ncbi:MAG: hypothetical protein R3266_12855, partial [Gemmatimonadota bacterium]|nr:hypothetical protein [Gemmatimonadota bacterium]
ENQAMILAILLAASVATSILLGVLGKLNPREMVLQTVGMGVATLAFYGLVVLVEVAALSH